MPSCAALPALSSEVFLGENVHVWVEISNFHSIALCDLLDLDFLKVLGLVTISSQIYGLSSEYKQIMGCEMSTLGLGCPCRRWCQVQQSLMRGSDWGLLKGICTF